MPRCLSFLVLTVCCGTYLFRVCVSVRFSQDFHGTRRLLDQRDMTDCCRCSAASCLLPLCLLRWLEWAGYSLTAASGARIEHATQPNEVSWRVVFFALNSLNSLSACVCRRERGHGNWTLFNSTYCHGFHRTPAKGQGVVFVESYPRLFFLWFLLRLSCCYVCGGSQLAAFPAGILLDAVVTYP